MSEQLNQSDQSSTNAQMGETERQPNQHYGLSDKYGQDETLETGFGQSEQMGKDEWSAERYERQAQTVDEPTLDEGEAQESEGKSDIDKMVGGMIGTEDMSSES